MQTKHDFNIAFIGLEHSFVYLSPTIRHTNHVAMVTNISKQTHSNIPSTSTPGSMWILVICFTISLGECKSINLLWILISYRSQVLLPSPFGVFLVVILRTLVGKRTGPLTLRSLSFARAIKSAQTFSTFLTWREVRVMRIRWTLAAVSVCFSFSPPLATGCQKEVRRCLP